MSELPELKSWYLFNPGCERLAKEYGYTDEQFNKFLTRKRKIAYPIRSNVKEHAYDVCQRAIEDIIEEEEFTPDQHRYLLKNFEPLYRERYRRDKDRYSLVQNKLMSIINNMKPTKWLQLYHLISDNAATLGIHPSEFFVDVNRVILP